MTKRIFRNSVLVGLSVFLLSAFLFIGVLHDHYDDQMDAVLENESILVARGVEAMGVDYLKELDATVRITWVDENGDVLYDSAVDASTMENHADREEIRQALVNQQGFAQRKSVTLSRNTVYVARRLENGTVIRLASVQTPMDELILIMVRPVLVILAAALLLSAALSSRLSKRLIQPVLSLDLERPERCDTYDELAPLLSRLHRQNQTIQRQMNLLRQRQEEFIALTENMSEGFLLVDQQGQILSFNTGALRLLGVGAADEVTDVFALDTSPEFHQVTKTALAGSRSHQILERQGRSIQVLADPVLREEIVAGTVLLLLDVTEREQGERLRREFTANVSHELKTPLTSISGMAEIMAGGMVRPEDMEGFAGDIYKESQRLIALVEDIIHLSRLDEGVGSLDREEVDLLELARNVAERLQPFARKKQVELTVGGTPLPVAGYPAILEEMVYNLCDNAIKYNRPGGKVVVTVDQAGRLTVADTGIGIPAQDRERVFERFYRVDKSHSRAIGGTGLGLSIVKHGAALHNILVELDSELGRGTTVRLVFPE